MKSFGAAYRSGAPDVDAFLPRAFSRVDARRQLCARRRQAISPSLIEALKAQNSGAGLRQQSLAALSNPDVLVVVTGQQVGPLLGPLYTVHKAVTAVAVAQRLSEESGRPVVPIFWLQTEDHDAEEISTVAIPSPGAAHPETWRVSLQGHERSSVAHLEYGDDIIELIQEVERRARGGADESLALLRRHYQPKHTPASAFAGMMGELFIDTPLLFFDPRCESFAQSALPWHQRAIREHARVHELLTARAQKLSQTGFSAQVALRQDCCLSFFHPEGIHAGRYRLKPDDDGCALAGHPGRWSYADLWDILEREPLRASSSALLRPLLQDALFPTVAYVGGPAEITYFAQLEPLYAAWNIPMPLIVPRLQATWVSAHDHENLRALHLELQELTAPLEQLTLSVAERRATHGEGRHANELRRILDEQRQLLETFDTTLAGWRTALEAIDPGLVKAQEKTSRSVHQNLQRLTDKLERAAQAADGDVHQRLHALRGRLAPGGKPQERVHGIPLLLGASPLRSRVTSLLAAYEPFSTEPLVMEA